MYQIESVVESKSCEI